MIKAICQACCRVREYETYEIANESKCVCGGEMCACGSCRQDIAELEKGIINLRSFNEDFRKKVDGKVLRWTADHGLTVNPSNVDLESGVE